MAKSPQMQAFLDQFTKKAFGVSRGEALVAQTCVTCGGPATEFRDELSRKEYGISAMCQKCQDGVFGVSDGE